MTISTEGLSFAALELQTPQNVDAEEAILGGILLDPVAISTAAALIPEESIEAFYINVHREIYKATLSLHSQGQSTDLMSVTTWLYDHGLLEAVGGQAKLSQLVDRTVSGVNTDRFCQLILEKWRRRRLLRLGQETAEMAGSKEIGEEGLSTDELAKLYWSRIEEIAVEAGDPLKGKWQALRRQLAAIEGLPEDEKIFRLQKLADKQRTSLRSLQELQEAVEEEDERRRQLPEIRKSLDELLAYKQLSKDFDWSKILPPGIYKALESKAKSDPFDFSYLTQPLFAACTPFLGSKIGILVKEGATEADHWIEWPNIYSATIANPSSGKSSAERALFSPIQKMQVEENEVYKAQQDDLEYLEEKWKFKSKDERADLLGSDEDPQQISKEMGFARKYLLNEGSSESIKRRLAEQKPGSGVCVVSDELLNFFLGLDAYNGSGMGRTFTLTAWNGPLYSTSERVDNKQAITFKGQIMSLSGGIQPDKAAKFFNGGQDPDGMLSRFLLTLPDLPDDFEEWNDIKVSIFGALQNLYEGLEKLPSTLVRLSPSAHNLRKRQIKIFKSGYRKFLKTNPALSYFLGKLCSNLYRLALILHCIEAVEEGKERFDVLQPETMQRAIALTDFYVSQFRLMQAEFGAASQEAEIEDICFKVLEFAKEKGRLTPTDTFKRWRRKFKSTAEAYKTYKLLAEIKADMVELRGRNLYFKKKEKGDHPDHPITFSPETPTNKGDSKVITPDHLPITFSPSNTHGEGSTSGDHLLEKSDHLLEKSQKGDRTYVLEKSPPPAKGDQKGDHLNKKVIAGCTNAESMDTAQKGDRKVIGGDHPKEQRQSEAFSQKGDRVIAFSEGDHLLEFSEWEQQLPHWKKDDVLVDSRGAYYLMRGHTKIQQLVLLPLTGKKRGQKLMAREDAFDIGLRQKPEEEYAVGDSIRCAKGDAVLSEMKQAEPEIFIAIGVNDRAFDIAATEIYFSTSDEEWEAAEKEYKELRGK